MDESMRIRILGDAAGAQTAFQQVEKAAEIAAHKITGSFEHLGSLFKRTIGFAGIAVGIDTALESASKLINAQKAQAQLLDNQHRQQGSLIKLQDFQLQGSAKEYQWKSKTLDQMATQLSLSNAINKQDIVMAQNRQLTNTDLLKFYIKGNSELAKHNQTYKDIVANSKLHHENISGSQAAMATTLTTAANLAEVTGQGINGSMMMLTRLMADPAKRMSAMSRMGIQIAKADQDRIKALEKQKGVIAAQGELLNVLDKTYHGIAATAASPVEILKNALQNVWTALGEGLMPVLESLSSVVIEVVTPLLPVLQSMGKLIEEVAKALGTSLGSLISDLVPFIDLVVKGLLPAFLDLITPLVQMADKAITPLANAFAKLVGTGTDIGPLSQMFLTMGDTIGKNLKPAVDFIAKQFDVMSKNGTFNKMMKDLMDTFVALSPILPQLAVAFAQLVIAFTPAFIAALPDIVQSFKLFAEILKALTPLILKAVGALTGLANWITGNKGLTGAIGALLAIWFTKKLFLTPIMAAASGIGMLMGKVITLGAKTKGVFTTLKGGFGGGGLAGMGSARLGVLESRAARLGGDATRTFKYFGENSPQYKRAQQAAEAAQARAERLKNRQEAVSIAGGGFMGRIKNIFGLGGGAFVPTTQLNATQENTQALIQLTDALKMGAGGTLSGGFGSGGGGGGGVNAKKLAATAEADYERSMQMAKLATKSPALAEKMMREEAAKIRVGAANANLNNLVQSAIKQATPAATSGKLGRFARIGNFLKDDFSAFRGQAGGLLGKVGGFGGKLGGLAEGLMGKVGGMGMLGKGLIGGLGSAAVGLAMPLLQKVLPKSAAKVVGDTAQFASMGAMFGPWGAAIGGAIGLVKSLFQNCKPFHDFVIKVGKKLEEWGKVIWKHVEPALKAIWKVLQVVAKVYIKAIIIEFKIWWAAIKMVWNILYEVGKFIWNVLVKYVKAYIAAWKGVWHVIQGVWNALVSGGQTVWNFLKGMFGWISKTVKTIWNGLYNSFVTVANLIIKAYNNTIGGLLGMVGINAKITELTPIGGKPKKHHSGGIVQGPRGREVPAILQAGEAVISLAQMNANRGRGGGNSLNVHPGAVSIVVNGNADHATTAEIKKHVEAQFKELHRTLKSMGR